MSYAVDLAPEVIGELQWLSPDAAEFVLDQIDRLAEHPARLSRPSPPPFQAFQALEFDASPAGGPRRFVILFQYSQDEQTLHILNLRVVA